MSWMPPFGPNDTKLIYEGGPQLGATMFSADGKMLDKDPKKDCLTCHEGAKDSDYVLSKPLK